MENRFYGTPASENSHYVHTRVYPTSVHIIGMSYTWSVSRLDNLAGPHLVFWAQEAMELDVMRVM